MYGFDGDGVGREMVHVPVQVARTCHCHATVEGVELCFLFELMGERLATALQEDHIRFAVFFHLLMQVETKATSFLLGVPFLQHVFFVSFHLLGIAVVQISGF